MLMVFLSVAALVAAAFIALLAIAIPRRDYTADDGRRGDEPCRTASCRRSRSQSTCSSSAQAAVGEDPWLRIDPAAVPHGDPGLAPRERRTPPRRGVGP